MQGIENGGPFLMVDSVTKRYKLPSGYEVEALGGISLELIKGEMWLFIIGGVVGV